MPKDAMQNNAPTSTPSAKDTFPADFVPEGVFSEPYLGSVDLPGWRFLCAGKVRDLYVPQGCSEVSQAEKLLLVATDRISAYDYVLSSAIAGKGVVLTQMSLWWFDQLSDLVQNHVLDEPVPAAVAGRAVVCRRLEMYPVECVARSYLSGSALSEYRADGKVTGICLPDGLVESSPLPEPIFTPAVKAALGDHDENVSLERVARLHGSHVAQSLRDLSLQVYRRAAGLAKDRGIIIADTKFEFGALPGSYGQSFVLADEVLTPDSSRFWPADRWVEGRGVPSYDKQYVRDWLTSSDSGWDRDSGQAPPPLPSSVIERTAQTYRQAYALLTGRQL